MRTDCAAGFSSWSKPFVYSVLLVVSAVANVVHAGDGTGTVEPKVSANGTVSIPSFAVPLSNYMSTEARERFIEQARNPLPRDFGDSPTIATERAWTDSWYRPRVERGESIWPVNIEEQTIGGVRTHVVTPKGGVSVTHRDLVLINLHGGSFVSGALWGGLAESIPVAGVGKFKVIAVDYRMAPEYKFPAASEDVAAVYRALLQRYQPENIGIFGCSAGGILTGEVVAWFQKVGLPRPGAIGIFCAADAIGGGDSRYTAASLDVSVTLPEPPPSADTHPSMDPEDYLSNINLFDTLVSPVTSPACLARFPPTLLISGTRDSSMSSIVHMHAQLVKAGVDADLHVWDGMGHNFLVEMDLPESKEAYKVIAKFFDKHLDKRFVTRSQP